MLPKVTEREDGEIIFKGMLIYIYWHNSPLNKF